MAHVLSGMPKPKVKLTPTPKAKPKTPTVLQLRIDLEEVDPPIWRRLLVPSGIRLDQLHAIFQVAMGWTDSHLHAFTIGGKRYGMHIDDFLDNERDEKKFTVLQALGAERTSFRYEYDFGDDWQHQTVVVEVTSSGLSGSPSRCAWRESDRVLPRTAAAPTDTQTCWRRSKTPGTKSTRSTPNGWATTSTPRSSVWPPPTPSSRRSEHPADSSRFDGRTRGPPRIARCTMPGRRLQLPSHPYDHRSARPTKHTLLCRRPVPAPDRCLTQEFRSVTTTEGERNRFCPTATFADRETRESVIAHKCKLPGAE